MASYSSLSLELTKKINKTEKKDNGIYFTPPSTIQKAVKLLEPYMTHIKDVLEPSCGSCEYIHALNAFDVNITGLELNKTIFDSIQKFETKKIKLFQTDYLTHTSSYDLIIGNPPYFVMKKKDVDKMYYDYFEGRPNIFILFIIKSLQLLKPNGILSFILPKNFLNCLYYDKTRKYIKDHFQILHISECMDDYLETQQETILFMIQNKKPSETKHSFCLEHYTIYGIPENISKIHSLYKKSTTLKKLGFHVSVGNVVWNQCKDELTNDKTKTLLIYSSDIKNKKLDIKTYTNEDKKNYIDKKGEKDPILVINRGYGVGKYNFEYCLINEENETEYLIENHLICIKYTNQINKKELLSLYKKIMESFENKKTEEFIQLYFGNNAINTTELCELLPIYM